MPETPLSAFFPNMPRITYSRKGIQKDHGGNESYYFSKFRPTIKIHQHPPRCKTAYDIVSRLLSRYYCPKLYPTWCVGLLPRQVQMPAKLFLRSFSWHTLAAQSGSFLRSQLEPRIRHDTSLQTLLRGRHLPTARHSTSPASYKVPEPFAFGATPAPSSATSTAADARDLSGLAAPLIAGRVEIH